MSHTDWTLICLRLGVAIDFIVDDENMREVADSVAENTPFDRLYFCGEDRLIYANYGPEQSRAGRLAGHGLTSSPRTD